MRQHFHDSSKLRQMPTTHLEMQINQGCPAAGRGLDPVLAMKMGRRLK